MTIIQNAKKLHYFLLLAGIALSVGLFQLLPSQEVSGDSRKRTAVVEVSCDGNTFSFQNPFPRDPGPGGIGYGTKITVQGVIYPGGTFAEHGIGSGLLPDGTPEFPDLVIGKSKSYRSHRVSNPRDTAISRARRNTSTLALSTAKANQVRLGSADSR